MTTNPFKKREPSLAGPVTDILPVTPSDSTDLAAVATSLYVQGGGTLALIPVAGPTRALRVADYSYLPVGVVRVLATGTTATGIHALVLA